MSAWSWKLAVSSAISMVRVLINRLFAARIVESSLVLAAQAFLALFPLFIVVYSIMPHAAATGLLNEMRARFGVGGQSADAVQHLIVDQNSVERSLSGISFLIVLGSATAFTRALQRVYERAWGLPSLGLRGMWRGFVWLAGLIGYLAVLGGAVELIRSTGTAGLLGGFFGFGLWWWTPFLLLGGRVRWRVLFPGAVLTTILEAILGFASGIIMPRMIHNNESSYGSIGVVFAVESWLVVVAGVLVGGAVVGADIGLGKGRFGRWLRGTSDPEGWRREPHFGWSRPDETGS